MKIQNKFVIAGMLALPLIFSGCASDKLTPEQERFEKEKKNIIIDKDMGDEIEIKAIRRWESEHGLSKILIRARARKTGCLEWIFCSYETLPIAYRYAWYDEKGVEVETPVSKNWSILKAQYGEELGFNSTSPAKKAKDFKLFIKKLTKKNEAQLLKRAPIVQKKEAQEQAKDASKKDPSKETLAKDVKTAPSTPTQAKNSSVKNEVKANAEKTAPKNEVKASTKGTVAENVKVPPSTPTQKKVNTPKDEEAEADAASIRQAAPAKPAGTDKKN